MILCKLHPLRHNLALSGNPVCLLLPIYECRNSICQRDFVNLLTQWLYSGYGANWSPRWTHEGTTLKHVRYVKSEFVIHWNTIRICEIRKIYVSPPPPYPTPSPPTTFVASLGIWAMSMKYLPEMLQACLSADQPNRRLLIRSLTTVCWIAIAIKPVVVLLQVHYRLQPHYSQAPLAPYL